MDLLKYKFQINRFNINYKSDTYRYLIGYKYVNILYIKHN